MNRQAGARLILTAAVCFSTLFIQDVFAQGGRSPVEIKKVDGSIEKAPEYSAKNVRGASRPDDWFHAYVEYETEPEWLDSVSFKFYIVLQKKGSSDRDAPPYTMLEGDVTYLHIEKGNDHIADIFVHPSLLARYGDVERIGVIASVAGREVDMDSEPSKKNEWWKQLTPVKGLLLKRPDTPFAMVQPERFEMMAPSGN